MNELENSLKKLTYAIGCAGCAVSQYYLDKEALEETMIETFITLDSLYYELGMTDEPKIFYGASEEKLLAAMIENLSDAYRAYFKGSKAEVSIYVLSARNNVYSYLVTYMDLNLKTILYKYLLSHTDGLIEALEKRQS